MKKTLLVLISFLIYSSVGFGQNERITKLKEALTTQAQDTNKIKILFDIARQYSYFNKDSFNIYNNEALKLSLKNENFKLPNIYNYKAIYQLMSSNQDSARFFLEKAIKVLGEKKDRSVRASIYQNFANSYQGTGDVEKKIDYLIKSAEISEGDPGNQCVSIFNIGAVHSQSLQHDKAEKYFEQALNLAKIGKNVSIEAASLMALGNTYLNQKKLDLAKTTLEKSLVLCKKLGSAVNYFQTYSKLGVLYDKMKLFDKGEMARLEAKKYAEKLGDKNKIMQSVGSLASHYLNSKDYRKASKLYKEWEAIYEKNPQMHIGVVSYRNWSNVEGRLGNIEKSSKLLDKFLEIKDSIYSKENRVLVSEAETKYQIEKKDKELIEQNLQLEQQKLEIQKKKTQYSYMTGATVVLLVGSILLWFLYQQRQQRKNQEILTLKREQQVQTLESLMEGEEKERLRIAKELHDGVNVDLSAIKYKLTSLLEKNNEVINEAVSMIDKSCEQVRAISHNLIPPSLKDFSLIETIEDFCATTNNLHKQEVSFNHIGEAVRISKKAEVNIFRIVQELVNNSVKHADATEIAVQISHRENMIQLTVEDNGKGFDKEKVTNGGIGLRNIQSRVDYLNAKLDFDSSEKGTSYIVDINTNELV